MSNWVEDRMCDSVVSSGQEQPWRAVVLSLLLHLLLFGVLLFGFKVNFDKPLESPAVIIDAVFVDVAELASSFKQKPAPEPPPQVTEQPLSVAEPDSARVEEKARKRAEEEQLRMQQEEQQRFEVEQQQQARQVEALRLELETRQRLEEQKKIELAKQKKAEQAKREKEKQLQEKKRSEEQRKQEKVRAQAEEEAAEKQRLLEQQLAEEQQLQKARANAKHASKLGVLRAQYEQAITEKITRNWIRPISSQPGDRCEIFLDQIPGGEVVNVTVSACTGDSVFRRSIENAAHKVSPLPYEGFEEVFDRHIHFIFKPEQ